MEYRTLEEVSRKECREKKLLQSYQSNKEKTQEGWENERKDKKHKHLKISLDTEKNLQNLEGLEEKVGYPFPA